MAELDFSKIFGETATSKASFTDENYLNGWGYLGSTPPPYQLFDYLQSLNDKKAKYLYDGINGSKNNLLTHNTDSSAHADIRQRFNNYLPLTGGTVTGPIVGNIKGNADTATKATQDGSGNVITGTYLKKAGDTVTGALNVPTQDATDSSTKVANTAFVQSAVNNKVSQLVNGAPTTLDTLKELSTALGDDPNFATTVANMIGQKIGKTDIQVITGEVANGGTIPLPNGFLESECKWSAGIKHSNVNEWRIDPEEGNRSNLLAPICELNGRVVTVGTQVAGLDGGSYTQDGPLNFGQAWARAFMPGTAWYICIGIHR